MTSGHLRTPDEWEIADHLRVGAYWVESPWWDPGQQVFIFPTLYTTLHIMPGFTMRRRTRGHAWIPVTPYLHNFVAAIVLTEDCSDAQ